MQEGADVLMELDSFELVEALDLEGKDHKSANGAYIKSGFLSAEMESSKLWLFAIVIGLGICEKLSGVGNMISMERDWVPNLAARRIESELSAYSLTHLNAVMRRIDLLCKLLAPVAISLVISLNSLLAGLILVAAVSTLSLGFEVLSACRVWRKNPRLRRPKVDHHAEEMVIVSDETSLNLLQRLGKGIATIWEREASQMQRYFASNVWVPSLSLALLHLSVLQYSATFITFLLNSGFSLLLITIARAASSVIEVLSTFLTPVAIEKLARPHEDTTFDDDDEPLLGDPEQTPQDRLHSVGLIRSGLRGITLQLCCLVSYEHSQS
ncbi:hypothetical protein MMC07_000158 [Pseudocyphellaria aurata]|nr:hypothetical protein [Pseudocyphellaria aurata]